MAVFKCKMCGAALNIVENQTLVTCKYCGTQQTLPKFDDERKIALFDRANTLRFRNEFDKAAGIYEGIVVEFPDEAEAYWGLVLCKYGIEYVDDKVTGRKIPTCHRTLRKSVMDDDDFKQAYHKADSFARKLYADEAVIIDNIQSKILDIALNEEPYDIFICYKETDDVTCTRTEDSLIAQDIYTGLIEDGYKVFFARNSLRQVAGTEYEPYIYAALSSAKVMLAIGTTPGYYDAVWVKNEWSRFISMMNEDSSKVLIPCYKNMDAYDLPKEFKNMQGLDMGEVTFYGSLTTNIEKAVANDKVIKETIIVNNGISADAEALLKRAWLFLEDGDFARADDFCEQALNIEPECAEAYLGKLMAELRVRNKAGLQHCSEPFDKRNNYQKALRFGNSQLKKELIDIVKNIEAESLLNKYNHAVSKYENAKTIADYLEAAGEFGAIKGFKNADDYYNSAIYNSASSFMKIGTLHALGKAVEQFKLIKDYKNANELSEQCLFKIDNAVVSLAEEQKKAKILKGMLIGGIKPDRPMHMAINVNGKVQVSHDDRIYSDISSWKDILMLASGEFHVVGLSVDGSVSAVGNNSYGQCDVDEWEYITSVAAGGWHTVGLQDNGTVVAVGADKEDECKVSEWQNIIQIAAGKRHTVGLKRDGTVVATGTKNNDCCNVENWRNIVKIYAFNGYTLGIKADGTVECTKKDFDVSSWKNIVDISTGWNNILGLSSNGTVVAAGSNEYGQNNVGNWSNIIAISTLNTHSVGLRVDGTIAAAGMKECFGDLARWKDIVAISVGPFKTVGVNKDGFVLSTGMSSSNPYDRFNSYKIFDNTDSYILKQNEKKRVFMERVAVRRNEYYKKCKVENARKANGLCVHCGGKFQKKFIKEKCMNCGKPKNY